MKACAVVLLAALAQAAAASSALLPEQVHLALAGPGGCRVAWYTHEAASTKVRFGTDPAQLTQQAAGTAAQYLEGHGYHHVAKLSGLAPATRIFYTVGSDAVRSSTYSFMSAPAAGEDAAFSMSVFGDMGYLDSEQRPMKIYGYGTGLSENWTATTTRERLEALHGEGRVDMVW